MASILPGVPARAPASPVGITLDGLPGIRETPSGETLGHGRALLNFGGIGHFNVGQIEDHTFLRQVEGDTGVPDTLIIQQFQSAALRLGAAIGLSGYLDLSASVPVHVDFIPETIAQELTTMGPGDFRVGAKLRIPTGPVAFVDLGLLGAMDFPLDREAQGVVPRSTHFLDSSSRNNRPAYASPGRIHTVRLLFTLNPARTLPAFPFKFHLQPGWHFLDQVDRGDLFSLNAGMEWRAGPSLILYAEYAGLGPLDNPDGGLPLGRDFATVSGGLSVASHNGVVFSLGGTVPVSRNPWFGFERELPGEVTYSYRGRAAPAFSLHGNLAFTVQLLPQDADDDGVEDALDACPEDGEDRDGFQDGDGCPDEDNDGDGINDPLDQCPNEAEDKDGFEDGDGCPDEDNDADGIDDALDKCPDEPEDRDGFEDRDGCPDPDNDGDGIPDATDRCPKQPEDKDGYEDDDGCPEMDPVPGGIGRGKDCDSTRTDAECAEGGSGRIPPSVPDTSREAGQGAAAFPDSLALHGIAFAEGGHLLLPQSYAHLDDLGEKLEAYPLVSVEIRGYVTEPGSDFAAHRLSQNRAVAVRNYLARRGVSVGRMHARGMGVRPPPAGFAAPATALIEIRRLD